MIVIPRAFNHSVGFTAFFLLSVFPTSSLAQKPADRRLVAIVDGFEVRLAESELSPTYRDYALYTKIQQIADWRAELKRLGIDSRPKAVEEWREERVRRHEESVARLRKVLKHPDQARSIYDADPTPWTSFEKWMEWAAHFKTEKQIDRLEKSINVGRYRLDKEDRSSWPLWPLLEEMMNEHHNKFPASRQPEFARILKPEDIELLTKVSSVFIRGTGENPMGIAEPVEKEGHDMLDRMEKYAILNPLESELTKIQQFEALQGVSVELKIPGLERTLERLSKTPSNGRTRAELMKKMSLQEALAGLSIIDGRGVLAYLTLAKAGRAAIPILLTGLSAEEKNVQVGSLVLLKVLAAREALSPINSLRLCRSHWDEVANQALSAVALLDTGNLGPITAELIKGFEDEPTYSDISPTFLPGTVRFALTLLSESGKDAEVLTPYLNSKKPGVRLQAAVGLAKFKDARAFEIVKDILELTTSEYERGPAFQILVSLGLPEAIPFLDDFAQRKNDDGAHLAARQIEILPIPMRDRWEKFGKWAQGPKSATTYWAFEQIEAGFRRETPEAIQAMAQVSSNSEALYSRRAKELIHLRNLKVKK